MRRSPIILSQPDKAGLILPLILTKICIALVAGYTLDLFFRKANESTLRPHQRLRPGRRRCPS